MKVVDGFVVCNVAGKTVAVASGKLSKKFNGMITLNASGEELFKMLQVGTDEEKMVARLMELYEIDEETAKKDVRAFLAGLEDAKLIVD